MESEMPAEVDQAMVDVALAEARAGLAVGGVPVGAALAAGGRLIASGHNERVQSGDPFARLWRDANPALLRYLRVIALGAEEDIAAETWVQVVRGLPAFRGDEQAWRAWLFTTARRRAIDLARRRSRRPETPLDDVTAAQ